MRSKNKPAQSLAETAHGWISIPLCPACHRGPDGWHGTRLRWTLHKMTELRAINETLRRVYG